MRPRPGCTPARLLRIPLAGFCEFLYLLFGLDDAFAAPRRELRLVLFQANCDAAAPGLYAFAELRDIRSTRAWLVFVFGPRDGRIEQHGKDDKIRDGGRFVGPIGGHWSCGTKHR